MIPLLDILFPDIQSKHFSEDELKRNKLLCKKMCDEYGFRIIDTSDIDSQTSEDDFFIFEEKDVFGPSETDYKVDLIIRSAAEKYPQKG